MTNVTRKQVRVGIAEFFGGTVFDPQFQLYRPTPLGAYGLAAVRLYWSVRLEDRFFYEGLAPDRLMGAVMCVHIAREQERRDSFGGPISGIKSQFYGVELIVYHRAEKRNPEDAQADLDELIEAIKNRIHGDRTLGGAVLEAGESERGITTQTGVPAVEPATTVMQDCVIQFDAEVYVAA